MSVAGKETESPRFEAEPAHPEVPIEWWFYQGHYEGPVSGRRHFMAALFRSNPSPRRDGTSDGFQLLLAVLDPTRTAARHESLAWIDPQLLHNTIAMLKAADARVDPVAKRAFLHEVETHGPPYPIVLQPIPPRCRAGPLRIEWEDFLLAETETGHILKFREPDAHRWVSLHLAAAAPRMNVACQGDALPLGAGMAYHVYPRVRLRGTAEPGETLDGCAWMDHQWGEFDWFRDARTADVLGWDWFGANLDDGSDLLVMRHRDARSGRVIAAHATLRELDGRARTVYDVTLAPLRNWESPSTFIDYPTAWRIEVPELKASLVFEPCCDDQEIASFGPSRAVWEGAGQLAGTIRGSTVRGNARGEFHGYGYVFDHEDFVRAMGRRVDRHIEQFLPRRFDSAAVERFVGPPQWQHDVEAYTEMLAEPAWDLIDRNGKRWRPIFGILLLEALGVPSKPYEAMICCTSELMHVGALIVDDIEDDSLRRRGDECLHLRYGVDVALNAGNALYFLPGNAVMRHPLLSEAKRSRWLEIKDRLCVEAHCGQATDIYWSRRMTPENLGRWLRDDVESKILQMYAFKTASAPRGTAEFAAVIADASPETTLACVDLARSLGVAYQIVDDVHNFSRSPHWTKVAGEDLAGGKLTFVIATALRCLDPAGSTRLGAILCSPELRRLPAALAEGIDLVCRSGALDACRETARTMIHDAWARFSPRVRSSQPKILLHAMCLRLIDLAYEG